LGGGRKIALQFDHSYTTIHKSISRSLPIHRHQSIPGVENMRPSLVDRPPLFRKHSRPNKKISTKMKNDEQHPSQKQGLQPTTNDPQPATSNKQPTTSN
jgi:hypothetical protein